MSSTRAIACMGKQRYSTRREAVEASEAVNRRLGDAIGPYHCRFCGGFHAGHRSLHGKLPPSERRARLQKMRAEEKAAEGCECA